MSKMQLGLENVGLGAVSEKFDEELCKIIDNVLDPNTDAKTQRKITIDFKIKPNPENRERCEMEITVTSKLAPTRALNSVLLVGFDRATGEMDAAEVVQQQGELFNEKKPVDKMKIVNLTK